MMVDSTKLNKTLQNIVSGRRRKHPHGPATHLEQAWLPRQHCPQRRGGAQHLGAQFLPGRDLRHHDGGDVWNRAASADQGDEFADADLHHDRAQQPSECHPVHEGRCLRLFREAAQGRGGRDLAPGGPAAGRALERVVQATLRCRESGREQRGISGLIRIFGRPRTRRSRRAAAVLENPEGSQGWSEHRQQNPWQSQACRGSSRSPASSRSLGPHAGPQ